MLIDLLVVVGLGLYLWWPRRHERGVIKNALRSPGPFWGAFLSSRFGVVLMLLAVMSLVSWAHGVAVLGPSALNPALHTGELREQTKCFEHQALIKKLGVQRYAPSELICPSSGARLTNPGTADSSCPVHGAPP